MDEVKKIADGCAVEFNYILKDAEGLVIDCSDDAGPMPYLHGQENIVPGLEKELLGKSIGDKICCIVSPKEGYGERQDSMVQEVPKSQFGDEKEIAIGDQFQVETEDGQMLMVSVIELKDETIILDANHPLAGVELHFDVEVISIRLATKEELKHGHVHSPEGCGHSH